MLFWSRVAGVDSRLNKREISMTYASIKTIKKAPSLAAQVAEELKKAIISRPILVGEKLPGLEQLAKDFGVSRTVVREAIRALEMMGILEVRHGEGTFVKVFDPKPLAGQISYGLEAENKYEKIKALIEARVLFEVGNVELAIKRAQPSDIAELEEILAKMEEHYHKTGDEHFGLDLSFHSKLVMMTRNPVIVRFSAILYEIFAINSSYERDRAEDTKSIIESHRMILDAVRVSDVARAKSLMREHIINSGERRLLGLASVAVKNQ
jgi:GntR family transcriptional repressor for pyruvate dehydrogenase complex